MKFFPVKYSELNARQKEIFNFQQIAALLANFGYNCIKLADDWQGADFLALHLDGVTTLRVQLKGRLTVAEKYFGKGIWIAFCSGSQWYLFDHDHFIRESEGAAWLSSSSWIAGKAYSWGAPTPRQLKLLEPYRLGAMRLESADMSK